MERDVRGSVLRTREAGGAGFRAVHVERGRKRVCFSAHVHAPQHGQTYCGRRRRLGGHAGRRPVAHRSAGIVRIAAIVSIPFQTFWILTFSFGPCWLLSKLTSDRPIVGTWRTSLNR